MANYSDGPYLDRIAGADLSGAGPAGGTTTCLFRIVKQQADSTNPTGRSVILASAASDVSLGVLNNQPKAGETANVRGRNSDGTFKVIIGGTVTIGDDLTSDSNGAAITTTTTGHQVIGVAQESGVSGQVIEYLPVLYKH